METKTINYAEYIGRAFSFRFGGMIFVHELKGLATIEETGDTVFQDKVTMVSCYSNESIVEERLIDAKSFTANVEAEKYKEVLNLTLINV